MERHAAVFKSLDFPVDLQKPVFPVRQPLPQEVFALTGSKEQAWIGVAPFAQHEGKVYPQELMREVIDALAGKQVYKIFLFGGGQKEIEPLTAFSNRHHDVVVVAGKLDMEQELALISHLDVMLSMDSGNGHIAAMQGVKVITLWGATHPYAGFAPYNQPPGYSLTADREKYPLLPTSIYGNKKVEGYEGAMHTITPEAVVAKVEEILNKK